MYCKSFGSWHGNRSLVFSRPKGQYIQHRKRCCVFSDSLHISDTRCLAVLDWFYWCSSPLAHLIMSDNEHEQDEEVQNPDLSSDRVCDKYLRASEIVNQVLKELCEKCVPGADIADLCNFGDAAIGAKVSEIFKKEKDKKIEKGVAFPTCISVNECCGNFSPFKSESKELQEGDLTKIDLGCHIDGFICVAAHTIVVGTTEVITGRKADVLMAAHTAAEAALRRIVPGNKNTEVTEVIQAAAEEFKCNPVQGVLSHQMKQFVIDGNNVIISKQTATEKADEFEFKMNEVYGVDILISTGDGKPREIAERTTVYKRNPEKKYVLKSKIAREFIGFADASFSALPFALRNFKDEKTARVGVQQSMEHDLLIPYPTLCEKPKEYVAQFKFTVLLFPGGTKKVTGLPFCKDSVQSTYEVQSPELLKILAVSSDPKVRKKKEKKELKEKLAARQAESQPTS